MPLWLTSLLFAVLVVTIPFTLILKILLQLPRPLALSHRKWPLPLNIALIGILTGYVTIFIRSAYYARASEPLAVLTQFLIASLAYVFGLVLVVRPFAGVYPEYILTTGRAGLSMRKTAYSNITNVDRLSESHGETKLRVHTTHGPLEFTLPAHSVSIFYDRLRARLSPEAFGPHA